MREKSVELLSRKFIKITPFWSSGQMQKLTTTPFCLGLTIGFSSYAFFPFDMVERCKDQVIFYECKLYPRVLKKKKTLLKYMVTDPLILEEKKKNKVLAKSTKPPNNYREDYIKTVNFIWMGYHDISQDNISALENQTKTPKIFLLGEETKE